MIVFRNNGFIIVTQLPFLCEKTGALAIMELGLMAGRQAVMQAGRQADQTVVKYENLNSVQLTFKMRIRHLE